MAHIELGNELPGILGLLAYRPETAGPLGELAEVLLRGDNTLTRGERELIAAYVSRRNECAYCAGSHAATAAAQLPGGTAQVEQTLTDAGSAPVSGRLRALLNIAGLVQLDGRMVSEEAVAKARAEGATDLEIHDTVLIAAAFCMYNKYVDGLGTSTPADPAEYTAAARQLVQYGYRPRGLGSGVPGHRGRAPACPTTGVRLRRARRGGGVSVAGGESEGGESAACVRDDEGGQRERRESRGRPKLDACLCCGSPLRK